MRLLTIDNYKERTFSRAGSAPRPSRRRAPIRRAFSQLHDRGRAHPADDLGRGRSRLSLGSPAVHGHLSGLESSARARSGSVSWNPSCWRPAVSRQREGPVCVLPPSLRHEGPRFRYARERNRPTCTPPPGGGHPEVGLHDRARVKSAPSAMALRILAPSRHASGSCAPCRLRFVQARTFRLAAAPLMPRIRAWSSFDPRSHLLRDHPVQLRPRQVRFRQHGAREVAAREVDARRRAPLRSVLHDRRARDGRLRQVHAHQVGLENFTPRRSAP